MDRQTLSEKNDYPERFDPQQYVSNLYKEPCAPFDKKLHEFFNSDEQKALYQFDKIKVLDYGCGPVLCHIISAAGIPNVSEIVLAEYTARNREAVQQWLDKDPSAFDWSPHIKHVVKTLESKTEMQVAEREERMHSLIKVVSCDITEDPPIEKGYEGPYDIVISCLCLETSCNNLDEYRAGIAKLTSLVKPGGFLLIYSIDIQLEDGPAGYYVGQERFESLRVSCDFVDGVLKETSVLSIRKMEKVKQSTGKRKVFFCAEKKKN